MSRLLKMLHFAKPRHNLGNMRLLSSAATKGIIKQSNANNQNVDLLATNLRDSPTLDDLFSAVSTHYTIMNNQHVMQALKRVFTLQKQERNSGFSSNQILKHPSFEQLCSKLKLFAGSISIDDALEALKVMTYLNIPSNTTIYQTVLQLLRHNINHLSIQQVIFLNFLLKKIESTPLSDALRLALPIVFETQVPTKLDTSNVKLLVDSLNYSSRMNISRACVELIVKALLNHRLNERTSMGVLWSLCDLPPANFYEPLLKKVLKKIIINSRKFTYEEMETALTKLTIRCSAKFPFFYSQEFFDVCGDYIVENDMGFEYAVHFLRKVLKTDYFNRSVFDYTIGLCHQNPELLKMGDPSHVYGLVCTAALSDYRSEYLDSIKHVLMEYDSCRFEERDSVLRYATSLCVIDVYSPTVLQKVLNIEFLDMVYQKRFIHDIQNVLLISQLIKTYKPDLNYLLPNNECLRRFRNIAKLNDEFPLEGLLHKVFGGPNFIRTNVYSKMHHCIDHVVVLRKGGFPVPVNKGDVELEDISLDSSSQMILIMGLYPQDYTLREKRIKGTTAMVIKTLEDNGYTVVTIDLDVWKNSPDFEKIPFVMERIKQKTNYLEQMSSFC